MFGVIVNTVAIIAGGITGLMLKRGIPSHITDAVMHVLGAYVLSIGIMGIFKSQNTLVTLVSIVLGTMCGEILRIDDAITKLGDTVERKAGSAGGFSEGFITGTILYCSGAMGIVGAIEAGTAGDHTTLLAKSVLDGIEAIMLTASLGIGVAASSACVLVFEGGIALLSGLLAPVLSEAMIMEISAVGSLMIIVLGLNIMEITKIKVANLLPAIIFAPLFTIAFSAIGI